MEEDEKKVMREKEENVLSQPCDSSNYYGGTIIIIY